MQLGPTGAMSVAGLKKQFHKATQVRPCSGVLMAISIQTVSSACWRWFGESVLISRCLFLKIPDDYERKRIDQSFSSVLFNRHNEKELMSTIVFPIFYDSSSDR